MNSVFFFFFWNDKGEVREVESGKLFYPTSMQIGSRIPFLDGWELVFQIPFGWIYG